MNVTTVFVAGTMKVGYSVVQGTTFNVSSTGITTLDIASNFYSNALGVSGQFYTNRTGYLQPVFNTGSLMNSLTVSFGGLFKLDSFGYANATAWTDSIGSAIDCSVIQIDGRFYGGLLRLQTQNVTVTNLMTFDSKTFFKVDNLVVSSTGNLTITKNTALLGRANTATASILVNGLMSLDREGYNRNYAWTNAVGSTLFVTSIDVGGSFYGGFMLLDYGSLFNIRGYVHFDPAGNINVTSITSSGTVDVRNPVQFPMTQAFTVTAGLFTIDTVGQANVGQANRTFWQLRTPTAFGLATTPFNMAITGGTCLGGYLNLVADSVTVGGTLTFEAANSLVRANTITVSGLMQLYKQTNFRSKSGNRATSVTVTSTGLLTLDLDGYNAGQVWTGTNCVSPCSNGSSFTLSSLYVYGRLRGGYVSVITPASPVLDVLVVGTGAILELDPLNTVAITDSTISGLVTFYRPLHRNFSWVANSITVTSTGTIDFGYQGPSDGPGLGAGISYMQVTTLNNAGVMKGGALVGLFGSVTITGTITVVGGGYFGSQGPGAGLSTAGSGSGASYGGRGGAGSGIVAPYPYGTIYYTGVYNVGPTDEQLPSRWGSGGGAAGASTGGRGGGYVQFHVGTFVHNGLITANAGSSPGGNAGGGSGGAVWIVANAFSGSGSITVNGASGSGTGGGGAGGLIVLMYTSGVFQSNQMTAFGGSSGTEHGGPGLIYAVGSGFRNLRVDNNGLPSGIQRLNNPTLANSTGAAAYLIPSIPTFNFQFDIVEIYREGHLIAPLNAASAVFTTTKLVGDQTSVIHVLPGQFLDVTEVSYYKRVNISVWPLIYSSATWRLPNATIEWRPTYVGRTISQTITMYGQADLSRAQLIIGNSGTWNQDIVSPRTLSAKGLIIQDGGRLQFYNKVDNETDYFYLSVLPDPFVSTRPGNFSIEGGGIVDAWLLNITAQSLTVNAYGSLQVTGHGYAANGPGSPINNGGASHGGVGGYYGSAYTEAGAIYGDVYQPTRFGSGTSSSRGGGALYITVRDNFKVDGIVQADGQVPSASGGSIIIVTGSMDGYGTITASGGAVSGTLSGGSGGRIAVYYLDLTYFYGRFNAYGGATQVSTQSGACGTIYMQYNGTSYSNRTVIIDNNGILPFNTEPICANCTDPGRTWLPSVPQAFDEFRVVRGGSVAIVPSVVRPASLNSAKIIGDGTGAIHTLPNQLLIFQAGDFSAVDMNVYVQNGGRMQLPPAFTCRNNLLRIRGEMAGVLDLTIDNGCRLELSVTAFTSGLPAANFYLRSLTVTNGGSVYQVVESAPNALFTFTIDNLIVRGGAVMHFVQMKIQAGNVTVEDGGMLYCDQISASCATPTGQGTSNVIGASGAGHGGTGGSGASAPTVGQAYGNALNPVLTGCSGGAYSSYAGGLGGGALSLNVTGILQVDGYVHANGAAGSVYSGGGSGGSVLIYVNQLTGYGYIQSNGGAGGPQGNYPGGGGSGGRIAIYSSLNQTFVGAVQAFGGSGVNGTNGAGMTGAAGTIVLVDLNTNIRTLIVDNNNKLNQLTYGATIGNFADFSRESGRTLVLPYGADLFGNSSFFFQYVYILGGCHLVFASPVANTPYTYNIPRVIGDHAGTLHVGANQTAVMTADRDATTVTYNVYVYSGGVLFLPPSIDVYAAQIWMAGRLAQVRNMTLHHRGTFYGMPYGATLDLNIPDTYQFNVLRIQDGSSMRLDLINPIIHPGMVIITNSTYIEGGGFLNCSRITFITQNLTVDAGGALSAYGTGYQNSDGVTVGVNGPVNLGMGIAAAGGSGAGHGGSGGRGAATNYTGFANGNIYQPILLGSAGGAGVSFPGGRGGGCIWMNVTDTLLIDGQVTADAQSASPLDTAGGGSGGAIWIYVNILKGFGNVTSNGGDGGRNINALNTAGGGGAGGRIAIYLQNNMTSWGFTYQAVGGNGFEAGGPGTVFVWHLVYQHRTLIINNWGRSPLTRLNYLYRAVSAIVYNDTSGVQHDYSSASLRTDGCRAWILPESGNHTFANGNFSFHFEEIQVYGGAQLAVLGDPSRGNVADIYFNAMIGDRTGVVHLGMNQTMDLSRDEIDLPFSIWAYQTSYLSLAPYTLLNHVFLQMAGTLNNIQNITVVNEGDFYANTYGHTTGLAANNYQFNFVRVQDKGTFHMETHPVIDLGINLTAIAILIQGGGVMQGTRVVLTAVNVTVDDGGSLDSNGLGYHVRDGRPSTPGLNGPINLGLGYDSIYGASGGGHGGSSGRGGAQPLVGLPYGDLYEPYMIGSSGGSGPLVDTMHGGRGAGSMWINITNTLQVDGLLSADGNLGFQAYSGGGSGGSLWINCYILMGFGMVTARGGRGHLHQLYGGGGGAGGRIALYVVVNDTAPGFRYLASGGASAIEPGGPGTAFVYNRITKTRNLIIDNAYQEPLWNLNYLFLQTSAITYLDSNYRQHNYFNLTTVGCRAFILPESFNHTFAGRNGTFHFEEIQVLGNGHLVVLTSPVNRSAIIFFDNMIGDRTGTVHISENQVMDLNRPQLDLPFNVFEYPNAYLGLGTYTAVFGVFIQCSSTVANVVNMTVSFNGQFWANQGGHTLGDPAGTYRANYLTIGDRGFFQMISDPILDPGTILITNGTAILGGGTMSAAKMTFLTQNLSVNDGGIITGDGQGGHARFGANATGVNGLVNRGMGFSSPFGASGAGHGGGGGYGMNQLFTGRPYGTIYEPTAFGSAGGIGSAADTANNGRGGGLILINATDTCTINGEISVDGIAPVVTYSGGGSGGSLWIYCYNIAGQGNITSTGGDGYMHYDIHGNPARPSYAGGAGAGGRIALYIWNNISFIGNFSTAGGWSQSECGGPGTAFIYNMQFQYRILILNNLNKFPYQPRIASYANLSTDSARAWLTPESGKHRFAGSNNSYNFEELQIFGGAHLAVYTDSIPSPATVFFSNMIGDRTGVIHIGPSQTMNLFRPYLDAPFSSYVYWTGFLGLADVTDMDTIFIVMEGNLRVMTNLTLIHGAYMNVTINSSTFGQPQATFLFNDTVTLKADSYLNFFGNPARAVPYVLKTNQLIVEGGSRIDTDYIQFYSNNLKVEEGSCINASDGGYRRELGPGMGFRHARGHSGAGHGGRGGRGGGYLGLPSWTLPKGAPYGDLYNSLWYGSGGGGPLGGNGGGRLEFYVNNLMQVDGAIYADSYNLNRSIPRTITHVAPILFVYPSLNINPQSFGGGFNPGMDEFLPNLVLRLWQHNHHALEPECCYHRDFHAAGADHPAALVGYR